MTLELEGMRILATGSTHGIGKAAILKLAEHGADIIVNGRTEATGMRAVEEVRKLGRRSIFVQADITDYAQVESAVRQGIEAWGGIDGAMISGAGASPPATPFRPFKEHKPEQFMEIALQQWVTKAYVIYALLDHFIERGGGKIVNIISDAGRTPTVGESMLGSGAAAVAHMSKVLARECGRWGIRINTVAVSVTDTRSTDPPDRALGMPGMDSAVMTRIMEKLTSRRMFPVSGDDTAEAVLYFMSPASDAVTGAALSVNGGISFPG